MNPTELEQILTQLGFLEKEAKLYLKSLQTGPATAGNLGKKAGINRSTAYYMLYNLQEKGLIKTQIINDLLIFSAEPIEKLLELLQQQQDEVQVKKDLLQKSLPAFQNLHSDQYQDSSVQVFTDKKHIEKAYKNLPWDNAEIWGCFSPGRFDRIFSQDLFWGCHNLDTFRAQKGRTLVTQTKGSQRFEKACEKAHCQLENRSYGDVELETDMCLFPDRVLLVELNPDSPRALLMSDPAIVGSYRQMYSSIWEGQGS